MPSLQADEMQPPISTDKHRGGLEIVCPGAHRSVMQTEALCYLQKQVTNRPTHTPPKQLLHGLATLRPLFLLKIKVSNTGEKGEMILQNHNKLFLWFGIYELPHMLRIPNTGKANCSVSQYYLEAPAKMRNLMLLTPYTTLLECKSSGGHRTIEIGN